MSTFHLPNGKEVKLGCLQPEVLKFGATPAWDEDNPVLAEDDCPDNDELLQFVKDIKFQNYNNCTNAAIAGLLEALARSDGVENVEPLSMSMQYALHNDGRDAGAQCRDLADDVRKGKTGLCRASLWPESKIYLPRGGLPKEVLDDAKQMMALEVYQCLNWADVRSALARRFFVYHGFVLGNNFFNTGSDGKVPSSDGRRSNGHAMFSCGLTRAIDGRLRTITPNSWGKSFGKGGIGYIDESYFWAEKGSYVNLDAYAFRAIVKKDKLPKAS